MRRRFDVGRNSAGRRLDRFLAAACGDLSRSRLQKLIDEGAALVDGATERRASRRMEAGSVVEVEIPDESRPRELLAEDIPLAILHEDEDLLVLDKPPGLVVHPAPGHHTGTVVNAILHHCQGNLPGIAGELRPGIVHRLDRDTSGVLVVAKTDRAHASLSHQLRKRTVTKEYVAICAGRPKLRKGEVALAIGRDPRERKRMKAFPQAAPPSIREARTMYAIEKEWTDLDLSLLRLRLVTGRTHQIRVHLAAIGCPIIGDPVYGKPRYPKVKSAALKAALASFPRQALHAERIAFRHPATGEPVGFTAPLPADIRKLLAEIETATEEYG